MSAIAIFTLLPKSSIDELRDACLPKKTFFGKPKDVFFSFLSERGRALGGYNWSGYVLATLLPYLEQKKNINLMKSEFDELGTFICKARGCTAFILTNQHRDAYLQQLNPAAYSESELRTYFEAFNATKFEEAGRAMLDGIILFQTNLSELTPESFVLLTIG